MSCIDLWCVFGEIRVISGVPHGSHVGPIWFSFYFNDISRSLKFSKFLLYADDLKLCAVTNSGVRLWQTAEILKKIQLELLLSGKSFEC